MKHKRITKNMIECYRNALYILSLLETGDIREEFKKSLRETQNEMIRVCLKYFKANHIEPKDVK